MRLPRYAFGSARNDNRTGIAALHYISLAMTLWKIDCRASPNRKPNAMTIWEIITRRKLLSPRSHFTFRF